MTRHSLYVAFLAAAALVAPTNAASAGQVYLYPKAGPQGEPVKVTSDVPDVAQLTIQPVRS